MPRSASTHSRFASSQANSTIYRTHKRIHRQEQKRDELNLPIANRKRKLFIEEEICH